uniref:Uncharacterized protein n=1 Tax=Romanomermis culicivorax TaxID=13658 RepID=A0A915JVI4_ROMCU
MAWVRNPHPKSATKLSTAATAVAHFTRSNLTPSSSDIFFFWASIVIRDEKSINTVRPAIPGAPGFPGSPGTPGLSIDRPAGPLSPADPTSPGGPFKPFLYTGRPPPPRLEVHRNPLRRLGQALPVVLVGTCSLQQHCILKKLDIVLVDHMGMFDFLIYGKRFRLAKQANRKIVELVADDQLYFRILKDRPKSDPKTPKKRRHDDSVEIFQ